MILPSKSLHFLFALFSLFLFTGCISNVIKATSHQQLSLATLDHDLENIIGFCERHFVTKELDREFLAKAGYREEPVAKDEKAKTRQQELLLFIRPSRKDAEGKIELREAGVLVENQNPVEPSCGLYDVNGSYVIGKMDKRVKLELKQRGYVLKQELETWLSQPKEIYARNGSVFLVETIEIKSKENRHIAAAYFSIRKLKIDEEEFDAIWPIMAEIRAKDDFARGYKTVIQTYIVMNFAEKLFKNKNKKELAEIVLSVKRNNFSKLPDAGLPDASWQQQHNQNARIANQQAQTQYNKTRENQQQFIQQTRARHATPPPMPQRPPPVVIPPVTRHGVAN